MSSIQNTSQSATFSRRTLRQTVQGHLRLEFALDPDSEQTRLRIREQRQPLKVIRAFPLKDGGALVHLHNVSGGVLGGDQLELTVQVEARAYAQLTSTSATRLYRSQPSVPFAQQETRIRVEPGGICEYLPDPLIPFAGSRYRQRTHIELADDAALCWWEMVAPGRTAHSECFQYETLHMTVDINARGHPIACERLLLEPALRPLSSSVRLGHYTYFCNLYICHVGRPASQWHQLEQELRLLAQELSQPNTTHWGVSTLAAHGVLVRGLSLQGRDLIAGLLKYWQMASQSLYGRTATAPRKIY